MKWYIYGHYTILACPGNFEKTITTRAYHKISDIIDF